MNRRTFLRNSVGGLAGGFLLNETGNTAVASAREKLSRIGLQLYTVRKNLESDFEGTLRQVAALGIKEVEFAGYFGQKSEQIKSLLKKFSLTAPSAHIDLQTLEKNLAQVIDDAMAIGHKYLVLAYLPEERRKSSDDYKKLIKLLNLAGERCRKAGLQLAYHNHDFEFTKIGGRIPFDLILAETDARLVKMEMDLYWTTKAGFDPVSYFEMYPGRFPLLHVKDMDNSPKKGFTEVGRGVIDFKKIFSNAGKAGVRHYFIEQDETPAESLESVKISLKYLRELKF